MDAIQATIVDARLAQPNKLDIIVAKPRMHAQHQGSAHFMIWLIEPRQRQELENALCVAPPLRNEQIVISGRNTNDFENVSRIIIQLEHMLLPGAKLMVLSYNRKVVDFANKWQGSALVRGTRLIHYRSTIFRCLISPPAVGCSLATENNPPIQRVVQPYATLTRGEASTRINSFDKIDRIQDRPRDNVGGNLAGWERILTLLSQWVSPKANEIVRKVLERPLTLGESLSWGEITRHGLVKQLECELRADEHIGCHNPSEKNAQKFFTRLMGASALLNQNGERADARDRSEAIAKVDLQFRELLLEWIILSVAGGDPVNFGNGDSASIKRLEAIIDRLLIKRRIAAESPDKLY